MIILLAITIFIIFVLFRMSSDSSNTAPFATSHTELNESTFQNMVRLAKVSLALNSGGDSGMVSFSDDNSKIIFVTNGTNTFWEYRDELGISEEVLLERQCGGCPPSEWEWYMNFMRSVQIDGWKYCFTAIIPVETRSASAYLSKLAQFLKNTYPNITVTATNDKVSVYTRDSDRVNASYR